MTQFKIPFNRPSIVGNELKYVTDVIERGHASGDGEYTERCSQLLERSLGVPCALLTTSCTHALEMSALLLDIRPGDEVIVPSFTFVSTVNAFVLRGARPVFIDIRPDTLNLDESQLESLITRRTKAIVVVHYGGVACDMDAIMQIAGRHDVPVVEDNAHGLYAKYRGKYLGSFGRMATQSFHETKNFSCGEGGALIVNDPNLIERAEILRQKGTNRSQFLRGAVEKYTWVDLGSSYLPSDILAAFLFAQLEEREQIGRARQGIWERYESGLRGWAEKNDVGLPTIPPECDHSFHLFYLLLPSPAHQRKFIDYLGSHGILSVFHYVPLSTSPMGQQYGYRRGQFPVAEDMSERLVRLPLFNSLGEDDQNFVIERILTAL